MRIQLNRIGKRFRYRPIFEGVDLDLSPQHRYAITGPNGSGKSTLLKIIAGQLTPSNGQITYSLQGKSVEVGAVYQHLAYAAPYIDLIESFSLTENLRFYNSLKSFQNNLSIAGLKDMLNLRAGKDQAIKYFSSGMKQRLRLALAICTDSPILLLDEPTTNLDKQGMRWYAQLLQQFSNDRLVIIASNIESDYEICEEIVNIMDYKKPS